MSMNNLKLMLWQQHYALIIVLYLSQEKIKSKNWEGVGWSMLCLQHLTPCIPSLPVDSLPVDSLPVDSISLTKTLPGMIISRKFL